MPHVRLDDRVTHHAKIMAAGCDAFALWVGMLAHANRSATDGIVPKEFLGSYFPALQGRAIQEIPSIPRPVVGDLNGVVRSDEQHQPRDLLRLGDARNRR